MGSTPEVIQAERRDEWKKLDKAVQSGGLYGGVPYNLLERPIETNSKKLQMLIDICLRLAEERGLPTWRSKNVPEAVDRDWKLVNNWVSTYPFNGVTGNVDVYVYKHQKTGRARVHYQHILPEIRRLQMLLDTNEVRRESSFAEAEAKAQEKLRSLLHSGQQLSYMLDGCFLELSKKSGIRYLVRKGRPTIAIGRNDEPLCALCLHPLAYYTGTWAGAMVPSDEVWAHLCFIKGNEHLFWRKANQIPIRFTNSGL